MLEVYAESIADKIDEYKNHEQKMQANLKLYTYQSIIFLVPVLPIGLLRACEPYVYQELAI